MSQVNVCEVCGDPSSEEMLIRCDSCKNSIIHRYCMVKEPSPSIECVTWICEDCHGSDNESDENDNNPDESDNESDESESESDRSEVTSCEDYEGSDFDSDSEFDYFPNTRYLWYKSYKKRRKKE
ncbi:uncharacterized protein LOC111828688 [Capsella rubella]|uniref:uncharacterized protein LOC111828688 n=1 Tax=Capsella rubella TaxID=81985 RepID=UPI000CD5513E|nr:uncharacterized protein LOC111828688 [Capsella rubella]